MTAPAQVQQGRGVIQEDRATKLGPFTGGLHNASGSGEFIQNEELYELVNMEVDTDGSLVNRPQINLFTVSGVSTLGASLLGVYQPNDGRKFLVMYSEANQSVHLIDASTGVSAVNSGAGLVAGACVQYFNRLWVVAKTGSTVNGGWFDAPTASTLTWTTQASMPKGEAIVEYRDRLWIACGMSATGNASRFYFSNILDPSVAWGVNDYFDCAAGNGQKLVDLKRLGQDLVLFKEHSTYKFTYTTDPRKSELNPVDDTVGVPAINCTVVYKNNTIYVLHDNSVYELFQYTYTRISDLIFMDQVTDLDLFAKDQYGLTLHRDRLFVRYFKYLYVYNLDVNRWSSWESTRKFSKVVVLPSASVGLDTAYAMSSSQSRPYDCYQFQDIRATTSTGIINDTPVSLRDSSTFSVLSGSTSIVLTPAASTQVGDWVYAHVCIYTTSGVATTVTPPAGWQVVMARQQAGTLTTGIEWWVWKRKFATGDTTFTFTFSQGSAARAIISSVISGDVVPVVGPASNQSGTTTFVLPGVPAAQTNTLVLSFAAFRRTENTAVNLSITGSVSYNQLPVNTGLGGQIVSAAKAVVDLPGTSPNVTYTLPSSTNTQFGGVQIAIPGSGASLPVGVENFKARITTKTYDFDLPQAFKVIFWWGIAVATSGNFTATLNIPNAKANKTWGEARTQYGTFAVALSAQQQWADNTPIVVSDVIQPTLGRYARKFVKLLKKVRFRQVYFTIIFDVITNGGIADASLRVYDLTIFIKKKQGVVKETS